MTDLLYMQDFDVEHCEATVEAVRDTEDGRVAIMLDRTCFYARGGGQDWDQGTISSGEAVFRVEEVRLDEAGVAHHIGSFESGRLAPKDHVVCQVDYDRRRINTRLHSAGHVIDMAIDRLGLDWVGGKGQHYPHLSAVEYTGTWQPEQAEPLRAAIERKANELIGQGIENTIRFMPPEQMHTVCRHVPENLPKNKPGRVVIYGDDFGVPCGGTHVRSLDQVGAIRLTKLKEKKGIIRVSYAVDGIN
ncbi:hypothetical protein JNJ66_05995 [Candidatus Saccharibacteria bacterium]|nr:hypothetical protein [Candidatus Saccharibacteria bacterium]